MLYFTFLLYVIQNNIGILSNESLSIVIKGHESNHNNSLLLICC